MILNLNIDLKIYKYIKIFICLNPLIFSFFIYYIDYVDFRGLTESAKYVSIANDWINSSEDSINKLSRLPLYPLFISLIFKVFGQNNFVALLFCQSLLGAFTFFYLIKSLETLGLTKNLITLLTLFFNLHIIYRFSVFLPNGLFIFFITLLIYNFTNFYIKKNVKSFNFMCFFIFLVILTRPIFQFSIIFFFPILTFYILKQKFTKIKKIQILFVFFLSYFLSFSIQYYRSYKIYNDFSYTTQTGQHLSYWVVPCLLDKYGCSSRDLKVLNDIELKYKNETSNKNINIIEKNEILKQIGINYFINEIDKKTALYSIFFSYLKLLLHTSLMEIYTQLGVEFRSFSALNGITFIEKLDDLYKNIFSDLRYFFWSLCISFIFIMRFIQALAILTIFNNKKMAMYILIILSLILSLSIPTVGMSNPRYRSEMEPLLLILGAIGIEKIYQLYKKVFLNKKIYK